MKLRSPHLAVALVVLAAVVASMPGCSLAASSTSSPDGDDAGDTFDSAYANSDSANVAQDSAVQMKLPESPLCDRPDTDCSPDEASACSSPLLPADGGVTDAAVLGDGAPQKDATLAPSLACRVDLAGTSRHALCSAAGSGADGAQCLTATDCAAGFECVGTPGQCRHYCCSAKCGTGSHCSIEIAYSKPALKVPVCVPSRTCKLLANTCDTGQTCSVVNDDGATSCVPVGPAKLNDPCDETNCAAGLVCLGPLGSRACLKLCLTTDDYACEKSQRCKSSAPLFREPGVGVCE